MSTMQEASIKKMIKILRPDLVVSTAEVQGPDTVFIQYYDEASLGTSKQEELVSAIELLTLAVQRIAALEKKVHILQRQMPY